MESITRTFRSFKMTGNPLCSATTYGRKPRPTDVPDEFTFKIYTGGLAGIGTADECAEKVIKEIKSENGYSTHEVLAREGRWFRTTGYDYRVKFRRS